MGRSPGQPGAVEAEIVFAHRGGLDIARPDIEFPHAEPPGLGRKEEPGFTGLLDLLRLERGLEPVVGAPEGDLGALPHLNSGFEAL